MPLMQEDMIRCPNCGIRDVRPSHARGWLDALMSSFDRVPFRCRACSTRFYRVRDKARAGGNGEAPVSAIPHDREE